MKTNEIIRQYIVSELVADGGEIPEHDTDPLIESGIIDSFGIMSLLSFLEEKFSIQISTEELLPENFETVATISALVDSKIAV
jgi:acyl carrier protein